VLKPFKQPVGLQEKSAGVPLCRNQMRLSGFIRLFFPHDTSPFSTYRFNTFRSLARAFCNALGSITPETDKFEVLGRLLSNS